MKPKYRTLWIVALVFALGVAGGAGTVLLLSTGRTPAQGGVSITTINGIAYYAMDVTAPSNDAWHPYAHQDNVSFEGVLFRVFSYDTADCPVLNVTGTEVTGATYSFLSYPVPLNCQMVRPMVLSPDGVFGAIWHQTATVTLLVKAG